MRCFVCDIVVYMYLLSSSPPHICVSVYVCVYIYDGLYPLIVRPAPPSTLPILLHLGFGEFLSIEIKRESEKIKIKKLLWSLR